tara:strand:- start:76 stop:1125 length:1050 start_codon:yes stop_codon:yes gene_type:complete
MSITSSITSSITGAPSCPVDDRFFLSFDSVLNSSAELSTAFTPAGDFEAEIDFSTTSSDAQTLFGGVLAGTNEIKLEVDTSGFVVFSAYVGTSLQTAITSGAALDNGKLHNAKVAYTGTTAELFINNVSIGTQTWALNGSQTIKYVGRLSTGAYFYGVPANPKLTDIDTPANSQAYALDSSTGTTEASSISQNLITLSNIPDANRFKAEFVVNDWVGSNEVVNGDLSNGTASWLALASAALSAANGALRITNVGANFGKAYQEIATIVGGTYELKFAGLGGTSSTSHVRVGTTAGGVQLLANTSYLPASNTYIFTALTTTSYLAFVNDGTDENYNEVGAISSKRILEAP